MHPSISALSVLLLACSGASNPESTPPPSPAPVVASFDAVALDAAIETARELQASRELSRVGVVVLDPRDGRLLATTGLGVHGVDDPFRNGPTGSTFKPITVAAALTAGLDPARRFPGTFEGLHDAHPRESFDAREVVMHSSNVGAAHLHAAIGTAPILTLTEGLGFGGPHRAANRVTDTPALGRTGETWSDADAPRLAGGIGLEASLVHLAVAYAAIANGGERIEPTSDGSGARTRVLSAAHAATVRGYLADAVREGTGARAAAEGVTVAGKTGSAHAGEGQMAALFVGFYPAEAPERVCAIRAIGPGQTYGGTVAAPAFAQLVGRLR